MPARSGLRLSNTSLAARQSPLAAWLTICLVMAYAFGDFPSPAILVDDDQLAERVAQHPLQVFRARRPATRITGLAFLETGLARRFAMAHLVVGLLVRWQWRVRRHWRPPPCGRGRQSCGRSWHDPRCRRSAPGNDGRSYRDRRSNLLLAVCRICPLLRRRGLVGSRLSPFTER